MSPESFGSYQVVRELGRGGMGVVYEVRHPGLPGRHLALKTLLTASLDSEDLLRFQREAHLLAQIDHPHVVGVHQLGQQHDTLFVVLDFVDGQPLDEVLRDGPLTPQRAAQLLTQLAEGVQALHDAGIVHRDLKPQNVVLRPDGTPVLLDFGLAREVDGQSLTQEGAVLGTPQFMSPEQARGDEQRKLPAVDVYGLGAVLYACLSGRPPFDGGSLVSILYEVLESPPPSLEGVPAPVAEVCLKALSKEPHARYASPRHLAQALEQALTEEAPRRGRRGRALVVGAGVLALGVTWGLAQREEPTRPEPEAPLALEVSEPPPPKPTVVVEEREPETLPDALDDVGRWRVFQQARAKDAFAEELANRPLLRFREFSAQPVVEEDHPQLKCEAVWRNDHELLTFTKHHAADQSIVLVDLDAKTLAPQNSWTSWVNQRGRHVLIRALQVEDDRAHFVFVSAAGDLHRVDLNDPDQRALESPFRPRGPGEWTAPHLGTAPFKEIPKPSSYAASWDWSLALLPGGRVAFAAPGSPLWLFEPGRPEPITSHPVDRPIRGLAVDSSGELLGALTHPPREGLVEHWFLRFQLATLRSERVGSEHALLHIAAHPDPGAFVTTNLHGTPFVWRPGQPDPLDFDMIGMSQALGTEVTAFAARAGRAFTAIAHSREVGGGHVTCWDLTTARQLDLLIDLDRRAVSMEVSPDGSLLALGLEGGWIEVWHVP